MQTELFSLSFRFYACKVGYLYPPLQAAKTGEYGNSSSQCIQKLNRSGDAKHRPQTVATDFRRCAICVVLEGRKP